MELETKPQIVKISADNYRPHLASDTCPFHILKEYAKERPEADGPEEQYFVFADNSPVKPANVRNILKDMLYKAGLDHTLYGMHSFRIGRATGFAQN